MAGGKETPRQKMIGMMYLVLTALLALNVSKQVLDAFVAIEYNIQKASVTQLDRGNSYKSDLTGELADKSNPEKLEKVKYYLSIIDKIDKATAERIQLIDKIKMEILEKSGEDIKTVKNKENAVLVWKQYDKNFPLAPALLNLMAVQAKDQYDVPMHEIIGDDIKNPKPGGNGMVLWKSYNDFRLEICSLVGTYNVGGKAWSFKPTNINTYKDNADLQKQVSAMIKKANVNHQDDDQVLEQLYLELTKEERVEMEGTGKVHWIGKTFDHSPLVAAIASLSSLQQEILAARAKAIAHIKGRVSTGEYSFNKIVGLAYGPAIANSGDEIELKVMMAAFDSDNQPTVTSNSGAVNVEGGQGTIKIKVAGGAEMPVSGTVSIKNKSGIKKTENWNHTIKIMKPQGTVALPEMNMLYRGYPNKIEGVASGYDQTVLTGNGVSLTKSGSQWIGSPGTGKTCTITVSGKNSVTNKTVSLGTYTFRVSLLPPAQIYFGTAANGEKGSKSETRLFAKYPPEIPLNVQFSLTSWELEFMGRTASGSGNQLNGEAIALLRQARPGSSASFICKYRGPDNINRTGAVIVKL